MVRTLLDARVGQASGSTSKLEGHGTVQLNAIFLGRPARAPRLVSIIHQPINSSYPRATKSPIIRRCRGEGGITCPARPTRRRLGRPPCVPLCACVSTSAQLPRPAAIRVAHCPFFPGLATRSRRRRPDSSGPGPAGPKSVVRTPVHLLARRRPSCSCARLRQLSCQVVGGALQHQAAHYGDAALSHCCSDHTAAKHCITVRRGVRTRRPSSVDLVLRSGLWALATTAACEMQGGLYVMFLPHASSCVAFPATRRRAFPGPERDCIGAAGPSPSVCLEVTTSGADHIHFVLLQGRRAHELVLCASPYAYSPALREVVQDLGTCSKPPLLPRSRCWVRRRVRSSQVTHLRALPAWPRPLPTTRHARMRAELDLARGFKALICHLLSLYLVATIQCERGNLMFQYSSQRYVVHVRRFMFTVRDRSDRPTPLVLRAANLPTHMCSTLDASPDSDVRGCSSIHLQRASYPGPRTVLAPPFRCPTLPCLPSSATPVPSEMNAWRAQAHVCGGRDGACQLRAWASFGGEGESAIPAVVSPQVRTEIALLLLPERMEWVYRIRRNRSMLRISAPAALDRVGSPGEATTIGLREGWR
ncbi:hypothetical protein C8Q77DRAFT_486084 [Trametes polyzona]|nr:hypothetical protein C8Q77DRAFT_486084 [Trametes polyzona]